MSDHEERHRALAYRLWEEAGYPHGRADEFWYTALEISDRRIAPGGAGGRRAGCSGAGPHRPGRAAAYAIACSIAGHGIGRTQAGRAGAGAQAFAAKLTARRQDGGDRVVFASVPRRAAATSRPPAPTAHPPPPPHSAAAQGQTDGPMSG